MKENNTIGTGLGFCEILCVAFIVLKICSVIKLWVLSPLWIQLIVVVIIVLAVCLVKKV